MTDIIKDFEEKVSGKVRNYLSKNRDFEEENVKFFRQELSDIGASNPTLIAFGNVTFDILKRNLQGEFRLLKIPHYANYSNKETYRQQVKEICVF